jgi:hypothetical protein
MGRLRGLDPGLDVAGCDEACDQSEQASQRAFGEVALEARAEVAAQEAAGTEECGERPVRRDRAAVRRLEDQVRGDPADRREKRRG